MARDETRFSPNVGSLFSFVELDNVVTTATHVTYRQRGGITSGYYWNFTGTCTLQYWTDGTWYDAAGSKSASYTGYGDKVYDTITDSFARRSENRTVSVGCLASATVNGTYSSARAYIDFTVPALPPDATTLTAARNSDTSVTLTWAAASGVKESVRVERSTDGGAYSEIASVSGTATSYTDSTTSADHAYSYRVRYYNVNAYGAYSAVASVTMTPTAPTSISLERADATNVNVTLVNTSAVATGIEWQASYDNGSTWGASSSVSGSPVTSFTASTSGGTVVLRVRNVNETGESSWLVSDSIVTITPPAAPTLVSPTGVFNMSGGSVTFAWLHNPKDGSAQTAAQLQYSTNGGSSWTTVNKTTQQSHTLSPIPWAAGTTVTWRVRTKGADPSYGDWASSKQFTCYQVPSLTFAANNPPATVDAMPIPVRVAYSDPQGMACAAATVTVSKDGRTVYTEPLEISGSTLSGQITASELLPENGQSYTVTVTARSGSSLQSSTSMSFDVAYVAPTSGTLAVQNDPETGYVTLTASFDNDGSDVEYAGTSNEPIAVESAAIKAVAVQGASSLDGTPAVGNPATIESVDEVAIGAATVPLNGNVLRSIPDGACDVLNVDAHGYCSIARAIGSVDMSALSWSKGTNVYYAALSTKRSGYRAELLLCGAFESAASVANLDAAENGLANGCICTSYNTSQPRIYVRDDSIATVAALTSALAGVELLYQLATAETVELGAMDLPELGEALTIGAASNGDDASVPVSVTGYDGTADATSVSLYRVNHDGSRIQLIDQGGANTGVVDRYAPLNTPYTYEVVTYAASGAYAVNEVPNTLESTRWFAYWGENVAWAMWNPEGSYSLSRPEKKRVRYAGRKWPVSYDSKAMEQVHSMSWLAVDMDEWENGFRDLMDAGGRGVYKGCDGWVFPADFEYNAQPNYTSLTRMGKLSLTITRIDGDAL